MIIGMKILIRIYKGLFCCYMSYQKEFTGYSSPRGAADRALVKYSFINAAILHSLFLLLFEVHYSFVILLLINIGVNYLVLYTREEYLAIYNNPVYNTFFLHLATVIHFISFIVLVAFTIKW